MAFGKTLRRWASYRRTVRELNSLDDRGLNDLGISRVDIAAVARSESGRI